MEAISVMACFPSSYIAWIAVHAGLRMGAQLLLQKGV